jgi:hypothetical protein
MDGETWSRELPVAILVTSVVSTVTYLLFLATNSERILVFPLLGLTTLLALIRVETGTRRETESSSRRVGLDLLRYCVILPLGSAVLSLVVAPFLLRLLSVLGSFSIPAISPFASRLVGAWARTVLTQWMIPFVGLFGALAGGAALIVSSVWVRVYHSVQTPFSP